MNVPATPDPLRIQWFDYGAARAEGTYIGIVRWHSHDWWSAEGVVVRLADGALFRYLDAGPRSSVPFQSMCWDDLDEVRLAGDLDAFSADAAAAAAPWLELDPQLRIVAAALYTPELGGTAAIELACATVD